MVSEPLSYDEGGPRMTSRIVLAAGRSAIDALGSLQPGGLPEGLTVPGPTINEAFSTAFAEPRHNANGRLGMTPALPANSTPDDAFRTELAGLLARMGGG